MCAKDCGFSPANFSGLWYEAAYIDPAQALSRCPTLNASAGAKGGFSVDFSVRYGPMPFTITENYAPHDFAPGGYIKSVSEPGGSLVQIPTVIVDYAEGDYLMMYSSGCGQR